MSAGRGGTARIRGVAAGIQRSDPRHKYGKVDAGRSGVEAPRETEVPDGTGWMEQ